MKTNTHYYDSPALFLAALAERKVIMGALGQQMSSEGSGHGGWAGTGTYADTIKMATEGDYTTANKIKPRDVALTQHGAMNKITYDYAGDNVDVGLYLSGEPECMASLRRKGKPIINILVNIAASSYVDANVIRARGKAILEIMSGLEANGYGVDITICNNLRQDYRLTIKVKDAKEYFNLPMLAYWLTNPSVLRRLYFRHVEQESTAIQSMLSWGYGSPADIPQDELDKMPDCVYFPIVRDNDTGRYERAIEQIMETYKA